MKFTRPYIEDPEPGDENDIDYKLELFRTFKFMGLKPEDLRQDPKYAADYKEWLKQQEESEGRG